jgi:hypothetical protein
MDKIITLTLNATKIILFCYTEIKSLSQCPALILGVKKGPFISLLDPKRINPPGKKTYPNDQSFAGGENSIALDCVQDGIGINAGDVPVPQTVS